MYWKAYSLAKLGQRAEALTTLTDLIKQFATSRWLRDARALEVEVRQASGQAVSPATQDDEELKLMALRGIMQSDPEQALPVIEKMLTGTNSPKVKDRALFVLSQSHSARSREIISGIAKGNGNPDLQLRAIRYIGIMGGNDNRQILGDVYKASNDPAVKRSILRSFMTANDRERLFTAAKTETDASLRGEAIRQLGVLHASSELAQLYQSETSAELKKSILQSMFVGGDTDKLIELARTEKDPELRKTAIRNLGLMKRAGDHRSADRHLRVGRGARCEEGGHQRAVHPGQRNRAGQPGARREERRVEKGHRVEAVDHEVQGSDGLPDGAAEMSSVGVRRSSFVLLASAFLPSGCPAASRALRAASATRRPRRGRRRRARARGSRRCRARRRHLDRLSRADGRRSAADVLLRRDCRLLRARAACAASRAAAAYR